MRVLLDENMPRRLTTLFARSYGNALLAIEEVPVISCPHGEQSYLTAETLHEIERIKRHRSELAAERPVTVAALG